MLALRGTWQFLLLQPVAVPFFLANGLGMSDVFWLQSLFFATLCLTDIPAGMLAGRFGEHRILLVSCILKGVGGVLLCLSSKFGIYFAYIVIGISNALYTAVESTLTFANIAKKSSKLEAIERIQSFSQGIIFSAVLVSGFAGSALASKFGFQVLIVANAIFAWSSFIVAIVLKNPALSQQAKPSVKGFREAIIALSKKTHGSQFILIGSGATVVAAFPIMIQNRLVSEDAELLSFGALFVFQQWIALSLGFIVAKWESARKTVGQLTSAYICLLWIGGLLCLYFGSYPLVIISLILVELARISLLVSVISKFHSAVSDELRTKVVSVLNVTSRLYSAIVLVLIGSLSRLSLAPGTDTLVLLVLVLAALVVTSRRSVNEF